MLFVPQLRRSSDYLRVDCPAVGDAGAVHIEEKLALQSQSVPTHVRSANAASRPIRVSSKDKLLGEISRRSDIPADQVDVMRSTVACALTFLALTCLLRKVSLRLTLDVSQSPDAALNRNI